MPSINIEDLLEVEQQGPSNSPIRTSKREMVSHLFFFDEEIGEPKRYRDLINLLYTSSEDTEFNFMFNSPGGYLSSAMAIIEAIKNTDATVRAIIIGECHSAASLLALSCHEIMVTESGHCMIHTAQFGTGGTTSNVQKHADFSSKYINNILDSIYVGFLTSSELEDVKKGLEFWFDAKEIGSRLQNKQKYRENLAKKVSKPKKTI